MTTRINPIIGSVTVLLSFLSVVQAVDIYVDSDAPGANNGSSWTNAYHFLQDALTVAQPGDTIKVGQGTYYPDEANGPHTTGRSATFQLKSGVAVLGGFAGYNNALPVFQWNDRNVQLYPTVLSGDLNDNDPALDPNDVLIEQLVTAQTRQDNCYTVVTASNTNSNTLLDGFVIIGGNSNDPGQGAFLTARGGGIASHMAYPNIQNCVVKFCSALSGGGGMYADNGDPNLAMCSFVSNYCEDDGAGLYNKSAHTRVNDCVFEYNIVTNFSQGSAVYNEDSNAVIMGSTFSKNGGATHGSGIYNLHSDPNIVSSIFIENTTRSGGGAAMYFEGDCQAAVTNCRLIGNQARGDGGAVSNRHSIVTFLNCTFIRNRSTVGDGAAVYSDVADAYFYNCLFNGNVADNYGGALSFRESTGEVVNSTFASNEAGGGQAIACHSSSPPQTRSSLTIANSILWDGGGEIFITDGSEVLVSYSTIYNGWPGRGNLGAYPWFVDDNGDDGITGNEDDNLMLLQSSPCIDAGSNSAVPNFLDTDLGGGPRFVDVLDVTDQGRGQPPVVDMGAYEYGSSGGVTPPVADAGPDQSKSVPFGTQATVMLDGSGSHDPDGDPLLYNWTWTVNNQTRTASGVRPTIQLPVGQHVIQLVVFDGITYSDPDSVIITVISTGQAPVADAGPNQTIVLPTGNTANVTLDGSGSHDPDGDPLQYEWSWTTNGQPYQTTGVSPTIQLPLGQHTIRLVVFDGTHYSQEDTVRITVKRPNQAPIANAGPDQSVTAPFGGTASVTLDGSGSYDPDGLISQYTWTWTVNSQPYQASGVNPTIQLPPGNHTIQLVVSDGTTNSAPDFVTIHVAQGSQPPVANAGPDQTINISSGGQANVTLDGSGSYDPDGVITQYTWTWTINSQTYQTSGVSPTIQLPAGVHTIRLVVSDGTSNSSPDFVRITVIPPNQKPVANAGPDQNKSVPSGGQATVTLNGSGSFDPDGTITQYFWSWTLNGQPRQATGVSPTIQLPVGVHTITLVVYDGALYSDPDTVRITVTQANQKPVANAGPDQNKTVSSGSQATVTLNGSGSFDPDGSITQYSWSWTVNGQPRQASGVSPTIQLPVGVHTITLVVYDGSLFSDPDTVRITVTQANQKPVANAGQDQTVSTSAGGQVSVTLNGSGSFDPDGTITQYFWSWTVNGQPRQASGVSPTIQLPVGVHTITLVVYDGSLFSDPDTVRITVNQTSQQQPVANAGPDQTVSASSGGQASVTLNGSGSFDPDGVITQYFWSWTVNGQPRQATGVSPTIQLPVGQHTITLVVYDGTFFSTPDQVVITVTQAAIQGQLFVWPPLVQTGDSSAYVLVLLDLNNLPAANIDSNVPLRLTPGNIPAVNQVAFDRGGGVTTVFAMFDEIAVLNAIPFNGTVQITVTGQTVGGQSFQGTASLILNH